jgi:2-polyprenyl-3-methyl-5-hydroxy-6-metoxy-1,4-benzoquinol methylase
MARVLDIGCYNYKTDGAIGIDILKNADADIRASIYALPFWEHFDVITMLEVLEHLETPLEALRIIRNVLKPNGLLILSVPNMLSIDCMLRFAIFGRLTCSEEHIYSWTIAELKNIVARAGFDITYLGFTTPTQYYRAGRLRRLFRFIPRLSHKSILIKARPTQALRIEEK